VLLRAELVAALVATNDHLGVKDEELQQKNVAMLAKQLNTRKWI